MIFRDKQDLSVNIIISLLEQSLMSFLKSPLILVKKQDKIRRLLYTTKRNGEYGYYSSANDVPSILNIIKSLDIDSFLELGSGIGLVLKLIKNLGHFRPKDVKGFEIESTLINIANIFFKDTDIVEKDILTLENSDISRYESIYFWDPFCDKSKADAFANNLINILDDSQYVLVKGGILEDIFRHHEKILAVGRCGNISVFIKKSPKNVLKLEELHKQNQTNE